MKFIRKNAIIILSVLFLVSASYAAIKIVDLPTDVLKEAGINEHLEIERATNQITGTLYAYFASMLVTVLLLFSLYRKMLSVKQEEIVYVENPSLVDLGHKTSVAANEADESQEMAENAAKEKLQQLLGQAAGQEKAPAALLLSFCCNHIEAIAGAYYQAVSGASPPYIEFSEGYAFTVPESSSLRYEFGEGLAGQVAKLQKEALIKRVPEGYLNVISGLGDSNPSNIAILPVKREDNQLIGVLEIASFKEISEDDMDFLREAAKILAESLSMAN